MSEYIVFGPVPSRRLGMSLGINNIPVKHCSYSCIYCQLGKTITLNIERKPYYPPEIIYKAVNEKVRKARKKGLVIDYISFVPDGEPTLDINIGREISLLKSIGIKIAVLTNSSLLYLEDVRNDLMNADLVSLKIDSVTPEIWRRVDRPHKTLSLDKILEGIKIFSMDYKGILITETMLVDNVDYSDELKRIALFISTLNPYKAYIAIPTRPPAFNWVKPASEDVINKAYIEFSRLLGDEHVEYLIGYEGDAFASTGDIENDLLAILSVHPMRENAIYNMIRRYNADESILYKLISENKLIRLHYSGHVYYMRKISSRESS